ncbi:Pyrroline-5-carboxylate reductase [Anaerohalosphaera lusitana]|uniref:Pyrroline-5-carboxylate reductase n=1 Tax=Anaerohalosphaera lusitana TaxID=1936003 RepID=A0A1U9NHQ3_9BACT|nr:pyrroline-5-carboxylate reductase [Anaerohalosphaera lusitana]AQT67451.1 Pyrroline-5-carboxylate reductase [Anaerohalosphaera lusitana]
MNKIGFIGSGNMAEALIKGIISANLYAPENVLVSDIRQDRLKYLAEEYGVQPASSNTELASQVDVLVLSVKPQNMAAVLEEIQDSLNDSAVVISIAAGITTERIAQFLGDVPIIRAMPNTPAMVDQGATAVVIRNTGPRQFKAGLDVFMAVGKVEVLEDESLIDAVTAVSGTGPAYFFLLMEELINVAIDMGLPADIAKELVFQTAKGAGLLAEMAYSRNETPGQLRERVTSPGGTTAAAMKVLKDLDFNGIMTKALTAARDRSRELSQ